MKTNNIFLSLLLLLATACSDYEGWQPFEAEHGSLEMLPSDTCVMDLTGGTPPFQVKVEKTEVASVQILPPRYGLPGIPYQVRVQTLGMDSGQTTVWITDSEGRVEDFTVYAHYVQHSYVLENCNVVMSMNVVYKGLGQEAQELVNAKPDHLKELNFGFTYFSPRSGYMSVGGFWNSSFRLDDERKHITFRLPDGQEYTYEVVEPGRTPDNTPEYYFPDYMFPAGTLLVEDFTEEFRERFPGAVGEGDYVKRVYTLKP